MKNKVILLTAMFLIGSFLTAQTSFSEFKFLEQETYLFQKKPVDDAPWEIILQLDENNEIINPYAKFEYFNYPVTENEVTGFYFDLKGYNIPTYQDEEQVNYFEAGEYALIYYVDPDPDVSWNPNVYVLGVSGEEEWVSPAKGKAIGHEGVNLKIDGICNISAIPVVDDVNYPNGGKVWLVPANLIDDGELTPCNWGKMTGWNQSKILFESSLITYGYIVDIVDESAND